MSLGLGLDTGGTYTDAVMVNTADNSILEEAKSLTTKEDLVIGIENSLKGFNKDLLSQVSIISLSSTLATNSVVEGKGCKVGLICIGREYDGSISADEYICVKGQHDLDGKETEPLDTGTVSAFLNVIKDRVDCIAVTGYMSVRNPEHEVEVGRLAKEITGKPVVCGYQLSSSLGFNERTVTCMMNARLIPVIKELIQSVSAVMAKHNISAPIMIVKGDGSIMSVETAEERPVETILCGPAASLNGARVLTGTPNAVVVDMGGTTTDIGVLKNGYPAIDREGAMIGGHHTHVMAAQISTSGIGGDSRIFLNGSKISLKPQRVVPLCIAAFQHPEILEELRESLNIPVTRREAFDERNAISDVEFFMISKPLSNDRISAIDKEFLALINAHPTTLRRAASILNVHPLDFDVNRMEEHGLIQRISLTPTDLLHAEGTYEEYCTEASKIGVEFVSRRVGVSPEELIRMGKELVYRKISREIMMKLFFDDTGKTKTCEICDRMLDLASSDTASEEFRCDIALQNPIIGIGAPVNAWLPEVARRLHTAYISPHDCMVGNAVGAISGCIVESISILIEPKAGCSKKSDPCTAFSKLGKMEFENMDDAIRYAKDEGGKYVKTAVESSGAAGCEIEYKLDERTYQVEASKATLDLTVTVTASGKPMQMT